MRKEIAGLAGDYTPSLCSLEHFSIRSKISDVGFIEVSPPFHSYILDVTNWLPSPCKGRYPSRTTMEPPLPYPANEPDLGNPQLALCIG